ncbi:MAG: hypothetical protein J6U35_03250, partial [Clostridia bacterium]|nr:hypothetical protein [Clostridia bacterium]
ESGILSQPLSTVQVYGVGNGNSGVFNTEYLDKIENAELKANLQILADADNMYDGVNEYLQALAIGDATGYYTGKNTLSANSLAKVSVKLATIGGATAYVNVLDRDTVPEGGAGYNILTIAKDDVKANTELANDIVFSKAVSTADVKWVTVTFYIASGSKAIDFGVEVWNGERFSGEAEGVVIVDSITVSTTASETFKDIKETAEDDGADFTDLTFDYAVYRYNAENKEEQITTEVGGEEDYPVYSVYANVGLMFESETDDSYTLYGNVLATNYEDKVYITVSGDDEEEDTDSSSDSEDPNALPSEVRWLAISSIVLAIVLILVLIAVVVRLIVKKASAKRDVTVSYYDRGARDKAQEKINANKAKRSAGQSEQSEEKPEEKPEEIPKEQPEEEEDEYDYDVAGNIDESADRPAEDTAEEPAEQPADQPAEDTAEEPAEQPADQPENTEEAAPANETDAPSEEEK